MTLRLRPVAAALVLTATLLTGCSGSVSVGDTEPAAVSTDELEKSIAERITGDASALDISCADELPAEVGATVDCFGTDADGATTGFRPTVSAVDGNDIEYDAPLFLTAEEVTAQVGPVLEQEGNVIASLECEELAGEVGATGSCTAQAEGAPEADTLTITVEEVDGLRFRLGIELAS